MADGGGARGLVRVFEAFRDLGILKSSPVYGWLNAAFVEEPGLADAELQRLTATRVTQTDEARRAAVVRPALAEVQQRVVGLALVEVGGSSGLMLLPDRYGYRYT